MLYLLYIQSVALAVDVFVNEIIIVSFAYTKVKFYHFSTVFHSFIHGRVAIHGTRPRQVERG